MKKIRIISIGLIVTLLSSCSLYDSLASQNSSINLSESSQSSSVNSSNGSSTNSSSHTSNTSKDSNESTNTSSNTGNSSSGNNSSSSISSSTSSSSKDEIIENQTFVVNGANDIDQERFYREFYDYNSDIEITLKFTNNAIYKLAKYSEDSIKKEMYHPCDLKIKMNTNTYIFNESGARMKGNTSRNPNFVNKDGTFNAPIHFKISVSQTFDDAEDNDYYIRDWEDSDLRKERKKRRIGDAKKFDIKYNKNEDYTFTKQIYAYYCYAQEGMVSQKNNLVKVNIESESDSMTYLYELQECIDSEFIERRYSEEEASGNLYKCTYTDKGGADLTNYNNDKIGIELGNYHPPYDLKTNDDEPDHSVLKNLIDTLNNDTRPVSEFKSTFDSIVDADAFIKFAAMSWVIGNPDDLRNNYNNYYMYFNSSNDKAIFIPYDYDRCFGIMKDWEVHMEEIPCFTTKQNNGGSRTWQKNPLYWRTIISTTDTSVDYSTKWPVISEYQERYNELCLEYANKYLDADKYKEFNDQFVYSQKDITKAGANNLTFAAYAERKLQNFN